MNHLDYSFEREIAAEVLEPLIRQANWGKEWDAAGLRTMLDTATVLLGVWDGDRLVGFAKVLSDGVYRAFIEDLIVDELYRGQGMGTRIMETLIDKLGDVEHLILITGNDKLAYYGRFGFFKGPGISMMKCGPRWLAKREGGGAGG